MRALGVDIGGTSVKAAIVDVAVEPAPMPQAMGGTSAAQSVARPHAHAASRRYARPDRAGVVRAIRECVVLLGGAAAGVETIGLCVPGRRDADGLTVVESVNVPGLAGQRLDAMLHEAVGARARLTAVTSDAHAAAHDIACEGAGAWAMFDRDEGRHRLLALSLGTGVGACVLDALIPLAVSGPSPGHLGQIDVSVPLDGGEIPIGPDGGRGGLEAYIGVRALLTRLGPPAETVVDRLAPGDPALAALARAMRIAHAIYRPHSIALLGGVGVRLARHGEAIHAAVNDRLTSVARPGWRLVFGRDDFHAARGAARLAAVGRS